MVVNSIRMIPLTPRPDSKSLVALACHLTSPRIARNMEGYITGNWMGVAEVLVTGEPLERKFLVSEALPIVSGRIH